MKDDRHPDPTAGSGSDPRHGFSGFQGMELTVLRRYVTGEIGAGERRRVESWAAEAAEAAWRRIMARMEPSTADQTPGYRAPWDAQAVRVGVRHERGARRTRVLRGAFQHESSHWLLALSVAAVFAAVGIQVVRTAPDRPAAPVTTMRTVTTSRGQCAEIQPGDGTAVVLGVASRLRFASNFGDSTRDVYLDGTAYFRVVHDTTKPFTVHTANAVVRDVGTRFVVRAYSGDASTVVVVAEGSVALRAAGATTRDAVLTRDQLGVLAVGATTATVSPVDPSRYLAWMQGELLFHDTPLGDVTRELRR